MAPKNLLWVVADPAGQTPKEVRTQIRKQVMKAAVEAKKRKSKKPEIDEGPSKTQSDVGDQKENHDNPAPLISFVKGKPVSVPRRGNVHPQKKHVAFPTQLPPTGIEVLVIKYGIDHNTAAQIFGCISMETMASQVLNSDPQMISQISTRNTKDIDDYFGHVVRRYGHLPFLDNALQALIAKVKRVLSPGSGPSHREIWTKYGQALRGLQAAISSSSWDGPEVLCATQVLALFELLNSEGVDKWRGHIQGASRLVQVRGPGRFRTPFDIKIFLTIYPAVVCESFMICKPCFFAEPEWQDFIADVTDHENPMSERGRLNMKSANSLFRAVGYIPKIISLLQDKLEPEHPEVVKMANQVSREIQTCLEWVKDFNDSLKKLSVEGRDHNSAVRVRTTYGSGIMIYMLYCRIYAAIYPLDRAESERTAQVYAAELMRMVMEDDLQGLLFAQKKNLAAGILFTAKEWKECAHSGKLIDLDIFWRWCQIICDMARKGLSNYGYSEFQAGNRSESETETEAETEAEVEVEVEAADPESMHWFWF